MKWRTGAAAAVFVVWVLAAPAGQSRQVELLYQRARCYDDIRLVTASDGEVRVVCGQLRAQLQGTSSAA